MTRCAHPCTHSWRGWKFLGEWGANALVCMDSSSIHSSLMVHCWLLVGIPGRIGGQLAGLEGSSIHLSWYTSGCCFTLALGYHHVSGPFVILGRPLLLLLRPYGTLKKLWPVHQWTGSLVWNEAFVLITLVTASTLTTRIVSSWDWNSQPAWLHSLCHWSSWKYVLSLKMQLWTLT